MKQRCQSVLSIVVLTVLAITLTAPGMLRADVVNPKLHVITTDDIGWLGVSLQNISEEIKEASGLDTEKGVLINDVFEESPAEKAGLETGDIIKKFNGEDVEEIEQFVMMVRESSPGEKAEIMIIRDGNEKEIDVEIGARPEKMNKELFGHGDPHMLRHREIMPFLANIPELSGSYIGVKIQDLNPQLAEAFDLREAKGVLVIEAQEDGPAYEAGIRGGDVIRKINDEEVSDVAELKSVISKKEKGEEVKISVIRNKRKKTFDVTIDESPHLTSIRRKIIIPDLGDLELGEELDINKDFHFDIEFDLEEEMAGLKEKLDELKLELEALKKEIQ